MFSIAIVNNALITTNVCNYSNQDMLTNAKLTISVYRKEGFI